MQTVEDGEEIEEGQGQGPPGEEGEAPGEPQQDGQAADAAHLRQQAPAGGLVLRVLTLDAGQLDQNQDEDQQAEREDQEEVGHHAHVEGQVVPQPAAAGGQVKTGGQVRTGGQEDRRTYIPSLLYISRFI